MNLKPVNLKPMNLKSLLGGFALAAMCVAAPALPAEAGRSILVLDASGSMWQPVEGRTKVEIARDAVDAMLAGWNPDISLGLIAYGHNRRGDCSDIQVLRPAEGFDRAAISGTVRGLNALGMTPITAAVRLAAEQLRYTEQKATVILVSDGEETCNADPCALGRELAEQGIDFTAHVVGFDLPEGPARQQLQCLASSTGGRYIEARNAAQLTEALGEVATESPPPATDVKTAKAWIPGYALEWSGGMIAGAEDGGGTRALDFGVGQPAEECQAKCMQDEQCAGWHYEPTGSYFIDHPRCHLKGRGSAMHLRGEGEGWVAGVKPNVKLIAVDGGQE